MAALLANLAMMVLVGVAVSNNPLQMGFGFSPRVRTLFTLTALLLGGCALGMAALAVRQCQCGAGKRFERGVLGAVAAVTLVYAIAIGMLG